MLDEMDVKILRILQQDCTRSVADIGKEVGLSTTPCWRRIQKLEEAGVIKRRVAVLDAARVNAGVTVFVSIKTDQHSLAWLEKFHAAVVDFPEVIEFYRMSGEVDYLLRVVVPDIASYDAFYKKLISRIEISKVSSAFAMEQIKYTTALPLDFALGARSELAASINARPLSKAIVKSATRSGEHGEPQRRRPCRLAGGDQGLQRPRIPAPHRRRRVAQPPIATTLGFALAEVAPGFALFTMTPEFRHYNPIGSVHGGVAATLLDSCMSCAIQTHLEKGRATPPWNSK